MVQGIAVYVVVKDGKSMKVIMELVVRLMNVFIVMVPDVVAPVMVMGSFINFSRPIVDGGW